MVKWNILKVLVLKQNRLCYTKEVSSAISTAMGLAEKVAKTVWCSLNKLYAEF
jgi:hypothetical protein